MKITDAMLFESPRLRVTTPAFENRWMVRDPETGLYSVFYKPPRKATIYLADNVTEEQAVQTLIDGKLAAEEGPFAEPEAPAPAWNTANWTRIVTAVEKTGQSRVQAQPGTNDADFFAGALAAMLAMGMPPNKVPASWTLGLMFTKKSPLRPEPAAAVAPTAETNE